MSVRGHVFNCYINHLLNNNKFELDKHIDNVHFDAWFVYNYRDSDNLLDKNLTFNEALTNSMYEYLGILKNAKIETISDVDGLESENTYEGVFNTPVSSYLFSNNDMPKTGTLIEKDIYYSAYDYDVYSAKRYNYDIKNYPTLKTELTNNKTYDSFIDHFNMYDFSSGYDSSEYKVYGIQELPLCEGQTNIKVDNDEYSGKTAGFEGNGILVTWYNGERANEDEHEYNFKQPKYPEQSIPCAFFKLPKSYKPVDNKIKIQWSDDGLFSVT